MHTLFDAAIPFLIKYLTYKVFVAALFCDNIKMGNKLNVQQ